MKSKNYYSYRNLTFACLVETIIFLLLSVLEDSKYVIILLVPSICLGACLLRTLLDNYFWQAEQYRIRVKHEIEDKTYENLE